MHDYHYRNWKKKLSWGSYRSSSFFKFNILILKRFIKEMVTMQQEKDKHSAQIRYILLHRRKSGFRNTGSWNLLLSRNNNLGSNIFLIINLLRWNLKSKTITKSHHLDRIATLQCFIINNYYTTILISCFVFVPLLLLLFFFFQTWCEGMRGYNSSVRDLVVIWVIGTITQTFRLHLHNLQLYTGEE